jgi:hypothetical protein
MRAKAESLRWVAEQRAAFGTALALSTVDRVARSRQVAPPGPRNAGRHALVGVLLLAGCLVPPQVEPIPVTVQPSLKFLKERVDPPMLAPVAMDLGKPNAEQAKVFDVTVAVALAGIDPARLRYYWYWDYGAYTAPTLENYQTCTTKQESCVVSPCSLPNSKNGADHSLMVVVSDNPLRDPAEDPFDFPAGSHFDAVSWQLHFESPCP